MNKSWVNPLLVIEREGGKNEGNGEFGWAQQGCQSKAWASIGVLKGQLEEMLCMHICAKILRKNRTTKWQRKIVKEDRAKSQKQNGTSIGREVSGLNEK